jgi:UDP-N-acetylglucosamine 2-epimerase (non-hydrolysing)
VSIVGTRPEAIKLQPVAAALDRRGLQPTLLFTGQHPKLDPADYGLDRFVLLRLACAGQADPCAHVGAVTKAVLPLLCDMMPRLALVQGDTSSALGGALAAASAGIPLAHVEAGLRSHSARQPWPEEEFRIAIDAQADLLFAPTELSAANLIREGVRGQVHITGNSGIDSLLSLASGRSQRRCGDPPRLLITCHRRENWGESLDSLATALKILSAEQVARVEIVLHPNPALAHRIRRLLPEAPGIQFSPPLGHREMIDAMLGADLVLSDSGGMQEEAAALGVPLLVLRDRTERPEAIACGGVELVGTHPGKIVSAVRRHLKSARAHPSASPFGDGNAGERIAAIIEEWLEAREALSPKSPAVSQTARYW